MDRRLRSETSDLPLHFERVALGPATTTVGWLAAAVGVVAGISMAVRAGGLAQESLGVLVAGVGGVLSLALARCRSIDTVITQRMLSLSAGPLQKRVPLGFIVGVDVVAARSWRRLYARHEVVVAIGHDGGRLAIPTDDPDTLATTVTGMLEG